MHSAPIEQEILARDTNIILGPCTLWLTYCNNSRVIHGSLGWNAIVLTNCKHCVNQLPLCKVTGVEVMRIKGDMGMNTFSLKSYSFVFVNCIH